MSLLETNQSIGDIDKFMAYFSAQHQLTSTNRVIAWGCSFSGATAVWAAKALPDRIHAAVASSAPIEATTDFYQYNQVVFSALQANATGGSPTCAARVQVQSCCAAREQGVALTMLLLL